MAQVPGQELGLHLIRLLVEMHGGAVRVESRGAAEACRYHVVLPLHDPDASKSAVDASAVLEAKPERVRALAGHRLLLVDEDHDTRDLLANALSREGATVVTAAEAASALEALAAFAPDVVVSGIGLPGADGLELVRRLRADPAGVDVAAIAMSGFARAEDVRRALAAGFDAHIEKPFSLRELVVAIGSVIAKRESVI